MFELVEQVGRQDMGGPAFANASSLKRDGGMTG